MTCRDPTGSLTADEVMLTAWLTFAIGTTTVHPLPDSGDPKLAWNQQAPKDGKRAGQTHQRRL
jgi:hypothetical protein